MIMHVLAIEVGAIHELPLPRSIIIIDRVDRSNKKTTIIQSIEPIL
jgi:hypothetical protein